MSWETFAVASPELSVLAYEKINRKIAYLATIKRDGSPRLHPVTPFIGDGMLFIFTEPSSPKIRDLRRDGRFALHSAVDREGPLVEVLVSGVAKVITTQSLWRRALIVADSPVVDDDYVLSEFNVKGVLVVEYNQKRKPVVHHWKYRV